MKNGQYIAILAHIKNIGNCPLKNAPNKNLPPKREISCGGILSLQFEPGRSARELTTVSSTRALRFPHYIQQKRSTNGTFLLERAEGIEPSATGWKPVVLPLYYARKKFLIKL